MIRFIASGFGAGYLPYMPGTWGSLVALPLIWALTPYGGGILLSFGVGIFFLGWGVSQYVIQQKGCVEKDPSYIVIDEIAGMFLTFGGIQWFNAPLTTIHLFIGFIFFRLFDIIKPFPINWVEKKLAAHPYTGGLGIMVDDMMAALLASGGTLVLLCYY